MALDKTKVDYISSGGLRVIVGAVLAFKLDKKYSNSPIGKPIGDVCIHILDENGCPADEGELCLAGCFAAGYLNLPEQTITSRIK